MNQVPVTSGVPGNDSNLDLTVTPPADPPRKVGRLQRYQDFNLSSLQFPDRRRNIVVVPDVQPAMPTILTPLPGQLADYTGFEAHLHPDMLPPSVPGHGSLVFELTKEKQQKKNSKKAAAAAKKPSRQSQKSKAPGPPADSSTRTASAGPPPSSAGQASATGRPSASSAPRTASSTRAKAQQSQRSKTTTKKSSTASPFDNLELCTYTGGPGRGNIPVMSQDYIRLQDNGGSMTQWLIFSTLSSITPQHLPLHQHHIPLPQWPGEEAWQCWREEGGGGELTNA